MVEFLPVAGRLDAERKTTCYQTGYWRDEVVTDLLAQHAQERPDALAVRDGEKSATWKELHLLSQRFALHLADHGIGKGDVVALQLPNWVEYLVCYYGIQLAGALVVQIGADWRSIESTYALGIGPARAVIIPRVFQEHDFLGSMAEIQAQLPSLEHVFVARGDAPEPYHSLDALLREPIEKIRSPETLVSNRPPAEQVVRIVFTSGTTGVPKAIMHTNNTVAHSSRTLTNAFSLDASDVIFLYVPMSTNYGAIMGLHLAVTVGATLNLMDRFSATKALEIIERERVTIVPGTPTGFIALTHSPAREKYHCDALRLMISAGANFPEPAIKALRAAFGPVFIEAYGMNEFGMGFWCAMDDDPNEVDGTIGRPIPGLEAKITSEPNLDRVPGAVGELLIKSAGMCCGYFNSPTANASSWDDDGWFHTGDLATVDDRGNFRIVGRSKEVIIRGGANVSPREVEETLSNHPSVREVSVIGLPDPYYGEVVCACVITKPGHHLAPGEAVAYLTPKLASYKLPARIVVMNEFPLNSMGKVQKETLKRVVLGKLG